MSNSAETARERSQLESLLGSDLRELTAESDGMARSYAAQNDMSANDFRALLVVFLADTAGKSLTAGDLRRRMGLSGAAITYLIERMTDAGQLRRVPDPTDRRKVILHCTDRGSTLTRSLLLALSDVIGRALEVSSDSDLEAAHRTFSALKNGMGTFLADSRNPGPAEDP